MCGNILAGAVEKGTAFGLPTSRKERGKGGATCTHCFADGGENKGVAKLNHSFWLARQAG